MAHKKFKTSRETVKKTDRHESIQHTTHSTLKLPNMKYVFDKLIVMTVYTTVKPNLCIIHHNLHLESSVS